MIASWHLQLVDILGQNLWSSYILRKAASYNITFITLCKLVVITRACTYYYGCPLFCGAFKICPLSRGGFPQNVTSPTMKYQCISIIKSTKQLIERWSRDSSPKNKSSWNNHTHCTSFSFSTSCSFPLITHHHPVASYQRLRKLQTKVVELVINIEHMQYMCIL